MSRPRRPTDPARRVHAVDATSMSRRQAPARALAMALLEAAAVSRALVDQVDDLEMVDRLLGFTKAALDLANALVE